MEKIPELTYLKRITLVFLGLFTFFILANLLEVICYGAIYSGHTFADTFIRFTNYEGRLYFWLNICSYILHFIFLLIANHFVKSKLREKGTHYLIILLAFVPIVNYFLRFIIWRRLNKKLFDYSGTKWTKSDLKIKFIWILTLISETYRLIPFLGPLIYYSMTISEAGKLFMFINLTLKIIHVLICIIYFLYYLEFKRMLDKAEPQSFNEGLLDN